MPETDARRVSCQLSGYVGPPNGVQQVSCKVARGSLSVGPASVHAMARGRPPIPEAKAAEAAREAHLEPCEPYPGKTKLKWKNFCRCGAVVEPTYNSILRAVR